MRKHIRLPLHYQIFVAILLGAAYGFFLTPYVSYVDAFGVVFLRALKMIVAPLVLCSVCSGVARISAQDNFLRLGGKTLFFYLSTCLLAIGIGLFMVNWIQPGSSLQLPSTIDSPLLQTGEHTMRDFLLQIIPDNIFAALSSSNMMGIIVFAILFGVFLGKSTHKGALLTQKVIEGCGDVILKLTLFILRFAPLGIFGILASVVAKDAGDIDQLSVLIKSQGLYILTIFSGIGFHLFVTLSLLLFFVGRVNPWRHLSQMKEVMLLAFSTASSNGTLPLTLEHIQSRSHVPERIAQFTLPLGATINMNGTSLYECVAILFIAQVYGIEMSWMQQLTIVFASLMVGIGSAGIPMASLVMTVMIIQMVGLPPESIGLIMLVDRFADMARTLLNVYSDTVCTVLVAKSEERRTEEVA